MSEYTPTPLPGNGSLTQGQVLSWSLANYEALGMPNAQSLAQQNVNGYAGCLQAELGLGLGYCPLSFSKFATPANGGEPGALLFAKVSSDLNAFGGESKKVAPYYIRPSGGVTKPPSASSLAPHGSIPLPHLEHPTHFVAHAFPILRSVGF